MTETTADETLRREILPLIFLEGPPSDSPALVLLVGQPGSGRSRAVSALVRESPNLAVLNGDELWAFHPALRRRGIAGADAEPGASAAQVVSGWVGACIRFARENRRSLVLEGTFANLAAAVGTAERFSAEGFTTRVVVVGSRRAESLLSVTSSYLAGVQAGRRTVLTSRAAHDEGFGATRALVASIEESGWTDQVTILSRDGRVVFDAARSDAGPEFEGAAEALVAAQSARMGRFDATQWLSELNHATQFAMTRRGLPVEVTELLVDLHETSLREVIPELQVPASGKFATAIEQKTVARLVALRQSTSRAPRVDVAAPAVQVEGPQPGGVSR